MAGLRGKGVNVQVRVPADYLDAISADLEKSGQTESAYFAEAAYLRATGKLASADQK